MVVSLPSGTTQRRTEIKPHRKKVPYLCFNTLWKAEGGGDRGREERERENLTLNLSRRRSSPLNKYYKTNVRWIQARLLDDQTHPRTPAPVDRGLTDFAHQTHTPTVPSVTTWHVHFVQCRRVNRVAGRFRASLTSFVKTRTGVRLCIHVYRCVNNDATELFS